MASVQNGHISYKLYYSKRRQEKTFHLTSLSNKRLVIYQDIFFCIKIPNTKRQKFKSTKDCNGDLDLPWMNYGTKMQGLREIESKIQRTSTIIRPSTAIQVFGHKVGVYPYMNLVHSSYSFPHQHATDNTGILCALAPSNSYDNSGRWSTRDGPLNIRLKGRENEKNNAND